MSRRYFTAADHRGLQRCEATVILRDKSGAACMRRAVEGSQYCWQHQPKPEPPVRTTDEQIDDLRAIINEVGNQLSLRPRYSGIYRRSERAAMEAELAEATRELNRLERPND